MAETTHEFGSFDIASIPAQEQGGTVLATMRASAAWRNSPSPTKKRADSDDLTRRESLRSYTMTCEQTR